MGKSFTQIFIYLAVALFILSFIYTQKTEAAKNLAGSSAQLQATSSAKMGDSRIKILKDYLDQYSSPLSPNAKDFVEYADAFNLDWKLLAAISGVESTFGHYTPYNSYNAWGWGVYGANVINFSSWSEGIKEVSRGLRENYINKWKAQDVYQIGKIYASSSTWASKVEYFMKKISEFQSSNITYNLSISL